MGIQSSGLKKWQLTIGTKEYAENNDRHRASGHDLNGGGNGAQCDKPRAHIGKWAVLLLRNDVQRQRVRVYGGVQEVREERQVSCEFSK